MQVEVKSGLIRLIMFGAENITSRTLVEGESWKGMLILGYFVLLGFFFLLDADDIVPHRLRQQECNPRSTTSSDSLEFPVFLGWDSASCPNAHNVAMI